MSLDKAIKYGKEHRKPYKGSKVYFGSCRNHGTCSFCQGNRLHKFRDKHPETMEEAIDEITVVLRERCTSCGNQLFKVQKQEDFITYTCTFCGLKIWEKEEPNNESSPEH